MTMKRTATIAMPVAMSAMSAMSATAANAQAAAPPPCVARQLILSVDGGGGRSDGMQRSDATLSLRNRGADCTLDALPRIEFLDARGRVLPFLRRAPVGMHPGPVMIPVRVAAGHRAITDLTWTPKPAHAINRAVGLSIARVQVSVGSQSLRIRMIAVVDAQYGGPTYFAQPPLRAVAGMAAD